MQQTTLRTRLFLVAGAYAVVVAISAGLIFARYLAYEMHPQDAAQYSGMWAGGDMALGVIIAGMLLVVTFILVIVISKAEAAYTIYSKVMVAFSATAPLSIGLLAIPAISHSNSILGWACFWRAFGSPLVLIGLAMSRLFARFPRPKRLMNYALLIEGLTIVGMVAVLFGLSHFSS